MLLIAAALATSLSQPPMMVARARATASIRVVEAVRLHLDGTPNAQAPKPRLASIRNRDGEIITANLIEFQ